MQESRSPFAYDPAIDGGSDEEAQVPSDAAQICLVFLHYDQGADEFLMNRLARMWTRCKFMHVEAYFPDYKQTWSVDYNTPVHIQVGPSPFLLSPPLLTPTGSATRTIPSGAGRGSSSTSIG